jgi:hypothetical protein
MTLTIVLNPNGFPVINIFSKRIKFNADYYITGVPIPLAKWRKTQVGGTDRKLIVHADKARPHTARRV